MKTLKNWMLLAMFFFGVSAIHAQNEYHSLHSLSDYNYVILGELEFEFSGSVAFTSSGSRDERNYRIKTPVMLSYNLNDLKFFKAKPLQFLGSTYDEVLVASSQYPYELLEKEGDTRVDCHYRLWENGDMYEVKASADLYHFLTIDFNHSSFTDKIKKGDKTLQFRLKIFGQADSSIPQANVKGFARGGDLTLTDGFTLPVTIGCGTFFGLEYVNALIEKDLVEADTTVQDRFKQQFDTEYYNKLPLIDAMPLIDFLIQPKGRYEVPFAGSFASDSENGSEKAVYTGVLRVYADTVTSMKISD